jgi:5,5'-dehydrodivanillate O-demethylase
MLASEQNERLTRVSLGTPMGDLLARYWHPIATTGELHENPVKPVKLLGLPLTLFQDRQGRLGLVQQRCAHRRVDLKWGIPRENGLRCAYHGWTYDVSGQCVEMPSEPDASQFAAKVKLDAYPVQELGGLIWAYLGPAPAPLVPHWRPLVVEGAFRHVAVSTIPCNWLQCMENSVDPIHAEHLHGYLWEYVVERYGYTLPGTPEQIQRGKRKHLKTAYEPYDHGIIKRRLFEGSGGTLDWQHGHPLVFPNTVTLGGPGLYQMEVRVPVDDTTTWAIIYQAYVPGHGVAVPEQPYIPTFEAPLSDIPDYIGAQDMTIWRDQGEIMDRSLERLGDTDRGLILYRRMLEEQMKVVEDGGEPMNIFRDPAQNHDLGPSAWDYGPVQDHKRGSVYLRTSGPFSPVLAEIDEMLAKATEAAKRE